MGVVVFETNGSVVFVNRAATCHFTGPLSHPAGALDEIFPSEFAARFMEIARLSGETGEHIFRRTIWKGRCVVASCSLMTPDGGGPALAMLVLRCGCDGEEMDDLGVVDLGVLDVLTDRELEILAHIAKGRTAKRIAQVLELSPKTVEWHRAVIGRKLGQNNRVLLTRLAMQAGLTERDNGHIRLRRQQRRLSRLD